MLINKAMIQGRARLAGGKAVLQTFLLVPAAKLLKIKMEYRPILVAYITKTLWDS